MDCFVWILLSRLVVWLNVTCAVIRTWLECHTIYVSRRNEIVVSVRNCCSHYFRCIFVNCKTNRHVCNIERNQYHTIVVHFNEVHLSKSPTTVGWAVHQLLYKRGSALCLPCHCILNAHIRFLEPRVRVHLNKIVFKCRFILRDRS